MEIFDIGIRILFILNSLFFLIFFILCRGWSGMKYEDKKIQISVGFFLSVFYSFLFFLGGLLILSLISIIFKYYPEFLKLFPI